MTAVCHHTQLLIGWELFCPGCPWTVILWISASWAVKITDMSHPTQLGTLHYYQQKFGSSSFIHQKKNWTCFYRLCNVIILISTMKWNTESHNTWVCLKIIEPDTKKCLLFHMLCMLFKNFKLTYSDKKHINGHLGRVSVMEVQRSCTGARESPCEKNILWLHCVFPRRWPVKIHWTSN
jgi:hypothetical protein